MAMACFRLVTRLPEPPERSVPSLNSCMARPTFSDALARDAEGLAVVLRVGMAQAAGAPKLAPCAVVLSAWPLIR